MIIRLKLSIILITFITLIFSYQALATRREPADNSYKQAFEYIKKKQWSNAENLARKLGDNALMKIIVSQEFLDPDYSGSSFEKITGFLQKNPGWPGSESLKSQGENLINGSTDKTAIYKWFKKNPPITGSGYKYYALATAEVISDPEQLAPVIKNGWIYGCFNKEEQSAFYNRFKKYLTKEDHIRKIDNMLWKGNITGARKSLHLVSGGYQKSFEAQIAMIESKKDPAKLFKQVPKEYYTSGLIYRYINFQKGHIPASKEIAELIKIAKSRKDHGDDFWKLQSYLAREYIEHKRFNDAYLVATNHFAKSAANISDAEFLAGWLALRFLHKPKLAVSHFKEFGTVVKTPMSLARGLYWLGRAQAANGDKQGARKLYEQAAYQYGYTFYGQVATMELGAKKLYLPLGKIPAKTLTADHYAHHIKNSDLLKATKIISKYSNNALARSYLDALINSAKTEEEITAITLSMQDHKLHHKVWFSKGAIGKHVFMSHIAYPTPYKVSHLPTEAAFTYSILRQESVFDQFAISSASAMGLMQIVKPTACDTARKLKLKCDVKRLTNNPDYNLQLGSHYLAQMLSKYQNSYILTSASYNAGPGRINKWLGIYGDPRNLKDPHKVLDWMESIPFAETRNYVQRVLESLQIYRAILTKGNKFDLKQDLLGNNS